MLRLWLFASCLLAIGVATPLRMGSEMKSSEEEELDKLFRSPFGSHPFAPGKRVGFPHAGFSKEIPLLPTSINPENLGHFVSDIKSNLRKEFSALMAMADVEEALAENAQQLANHPSMFASRKRFYL